MKNKLNLIIIGLVLLCIFPACKRTSDVRPDAIDPIKNMKDGPITLKSGVVIIKKGNNHYWQGDVLLTDIQVKALDQYGTLVAKKPDYIGPDTSVHPVFNIPVQKGADGQTVARAFGVYPTPYNLWAMVRFVYAADLTFDRKYIIQQALAHWEANTNVRFYNATGQPTVDPTYGFAYPYILFVNAGDNSSAIGRQGGAQALHLAAFQGVDAAIHEIGHALGLYHEQSRYDRDNSININLANVADSVRYNFNKYTTNYYAIGTIDYNSIMMYGSYDFAINSSIPVMTKKSDGSTWTGEQCFQTSTRDGGTLSIFHI